MSPAGDRASGNWPVAEHFNRLYQSRELYWWQHEERYATEAGFFPYSLLTQMTLRFLEDKASGGMAGGRVLDLGAGEGADAIRFARLGHEVTAVEISEVGARKIERFAEDVGVSVHVEVADLAAYEPDGEFDLIICNGVLHYIADKQVIVDRMRSATRPGGVNVISVWSNYTPVPECHSAIPVYSDDENGVVARSYADWIIRLLYFERDKGEHSHTGMPKHSHSHVKLIAQKPDGPIG